jgi:hypothetical protein
MHGRVEFDIHSRANPDQIIDAFTDFSPRRPDRWPALSADKYEVHSVSETTADVREGQDRPSMWARERYDWSTPGTVTWTVTDSSDMKPGSFVSAVVKPAPDGGSDVHVVWDRTGATAKGNMAVVMMRLAGRKILGGYFRKAFDSFADQPHQG